MNSFPKIWALGSRCIQDILSGDVEVTEKIDGSQFGFGKDADGVLRMRSKGQVINLDNPNKMFQPVINWVLSIQDKIPNNTFYYGEAVCKAKHNTLKYDRVPDGFFVLFGAGNYEYDEVVDDHFFMTQTAVSLGCEVVPRLAEGKVSVEDLLKLMDTQSMLGGVKIEGLVIKRYEPWETFGKWCPVQCAKIVSEEFKEKHQSNPEFKSGKQNTQVFFEQFRTEARWEKAVQHLRDDGKLIDEPKDIGILLKELNEDLEKEYKEEIKEELWKMHRKQLSSTVVKGFAQWYKERLIDNEVTI